tara:strand:+ start:535 stop:792 length:258 start_codon:yes stop_codon:yes gene_type:complete
MSEMNKKIIRPRLTNKVIEALKDASIVLDGEVMIMTQYDNDESYFDTEHRPHSDEVFTGEVATLTRARKYIDDLIAWHRLKNDHN